MLLNIRNTSKLPVSKINSDGLGSDRID